MGKIKRTIQQYNINGQNKKQVSRNSYFHWQYTFFQTYNDINKKPVQDIPYTKKRKGYPFEPAKISAIPINNCEKA